MVESVWQISSEMLLGFLGFSLLAIGYLTHREILKKEIDAFSDIMDTPSHGLVLFDRAGRFKMANRTAARFLPFLDPRPHKNPNLLDTLHYLYDHAVDHNEALGSTLDKTGKRLPGQGFREVIQYDQQKTCLVELQNTSQNQCVLILRAVSDLVEHERRYRGVNRLSRNLSKAVEAADSGIMIIDVDHSGFSILFANKALCRLMGVKSQRARQTTLQRLFEKNDHKDTFLGLKGALRCGKNTEITLHWPVHQTSAEPPAPGAQDQLYLNISFTPVRGTHAEDQKLYIVIVKDITELYLKEKALFKSQKLQALGELAAGLAHDFNNILSIVEGHARLAGRLLPENHQVHDNLERICKASNRGAGLTRQMFAFGDQKSTYNDLCDLNEVVREQIDLLSAVLGASIKLKTNLAKAQLPIEGSSDNLSQILINLASNARDAMSGEGGILSFYSYVCPDLDLPPAIAGEGRSYVCLEIHDTGEGMDEKIREKVFDPFFTTKSQSEGTGLGLSVVYGLVRQMHGYIELHSEPGEGTCFSIYLPLSDKALPAPDEKSPEASPGSLNNRTVLVAEDEEDLLVVISSMLEDLGVEVIQAHNAHEALSKQEEYEGKIDLLLTDIVMPELSGVHLAELFRAERPDTPVVFMSGYPLEGKMAQVQVPEGQAFMPKPVKYETLARVIEEHFVEPGLDSRARPEKVG